MERPTGLKSPPNERAERHEKPTVQTNETPTKEARSSLLPTLTLPRGGGGIRGIGEEFVTQPATGTGSLSIPIITPPGRGDLTPDLALTYDSGAGNGPFGVGWRLSVPSISRQTAKGLPRYRDGSDHEDIFVLSGGEELVPWRRRDGSLVKIERGDYRVQRFRPRVEGAFQRIERWTHKITRAIHWRLFDRHNVTRLFGVDRGSRIVDPADDAEQPCRIFTWLLAEARDDRGNIVLYDYKAEDGAGVERSKVSEASRFVHGEDGAVFVATAQKYLKRICYGNARPGEALDWHFQMVFDYGDHPQEGPGPEDTLVWPVRDDAFSSYRAGFEMRTYRLCRRILQFHRFPELGDAPYLVRSTELSYNGGAESETPSASMLATLTRISQRGHRDDSSGTWTDQALPPLELAYTPARLHHELRFLDRDSLEGMAGGVDGEDSQWVDLDGEGIPGVLSVHEGAWSYKANLGGGLLAPPRVLRRLPASHDLAGGRRQLMDLGSDGQLDLVSFTPPMAGYYSRGADGGWEDYRAFPALPQIDWRDPNLRFVDLDGDGHADILLTEHEAISWYPSRVKEGFAPKRRVRVGPDEEAGPAVIFAGGTETLQLADLSGDGLVDLVRIRRGEICYWPNLGHGRFGPRVVMSGAPLFASPEAFDPGRVRFADIDGSGTSDLFYLGRGGVTLWLNQAGNGWSAPHALPSLPLPDDARRIGVVDLLGHGTSCLVLSSSLPGEAAQPVAYVDLMGGVKPHLLSSVRNHLGAETRISYAPSTRFYLADKAAGRPWLTRLAFPVHVIERVEEIDEVNGSRSLTSYAYHHGFFDGREQEFRGFAQVEEWRQESFGGARGKGLFASSGGDAPAEMCAPPVLTRTWFHTGAWRERRRLERELTREFWAGDPGARSLPAFLCFDEPLNAEEERQALRALRGQVLRREIYALDDSPLSARPYAVTQSSYRLRRLQGIVDPPGCGEQSGVFYPYREQEVTLEYERDASDPRIRQELVLNVDEWGHTTRSAILTYGRKEPAEEEQGRLWATCVERRVLNRTGEEGGQADAPGAGFRHGVEASSTTFELLGLFAPESRLLSPRAVDGAFREASESPQLATPSGGHEKRPIAARRQRFWRDDLSAPLEVGEVGFRALPYASYELALTAELSNAAWGARVDDSLLGDEGGYLQVDGAWWAPSGYVIYDAARFFQTVASVDPFGARHEIVYDDYALLPREAHEPRVAGDTGGGGKTATGNRTRVENDYRVLRPKLLIDSNQNRSAVEFDALGRVTCLALMGKPGEPERDSLEDPTCRFDLDLERWRTLSLPVRLRTEKRERHGDASSPRQVSWTYYDGHGRESMRKSPAAPGPAPARGQDGRLLRDGAGQLVIRPAEQRWIGSQRAVFDHRGKAIKRYEPFFSSTSEFEPEQDLVDWGVTPIRHYDPLGRLIEEEHADGTRSRTLYSPWRREVWDRCDTVDDSPWLEERVNLPVDDPARRAAELSLGHASTPKVLVLDGRGEVFLTVEDNGPRGRYQTRLELDASARARAVIDARGVKVVARTFDLLGRLLRLDGADTGTARHFLDCHSRERRTWKGDRHRIRRCFDALGRQTHLYARHGDDAEKLIERTLFGEMHPAPETLNLRGRIFRVYDGAGRLTYKRYDFKGLPLEQERCLGRGEIDTLDWSALGDLTVIDEIDDAATPLLEAADIFSIQSAHDALGRLSSRLYPDGSEIRPSYDAANLLRSLALRPRGGTDWTTAVDEIDYDARGERLSITRARSVTTYRRDELSGRVLEKETRRQRDGAVLQGLLYTWDAQGQLVEQRDLAQQEIFFDNSVVSAHARWQYDALYRLVRAEGRELPAGPPAAAESPPVALPHANDTRALRRYVEEYAYDPVGNLEAVVHKAGSEKWTRRYRVAEDRNHLLATSAPGDAELGPWSHTYDHDVLGRMVRMPHLAALRWNSADQLVAADLAGGGHVAFFYDSDGHRVRKIWHHAGLVDERIYLQGFEIYRRRSAAGERRLERETLLLRDGGNLLAVVETKTFDAERPGDSRTASTEPRWRFQLDDHLTSTRLELDERARVISYEEFSSFGASAFRAARRDLEVSPRRYRYKGRERDEETGLDHGGARYYASWLGRWTSADPEGLVDGTNLYAYVRNAPLRFVDPTGTESTEPKRRGQNTSQEKASPEANKESGGAAPSQAKEAGNKQAGKKEAGNKEAADGKALKKFKFKLQFFRVKLSYAPFELVAGLTSAKLGVSLDQKQRSKLSLGYKYGGQLSLTGSKDDSSLTFSFDPGSHKIGTGLKYQGVRIGVFGNPSKGAAGLSFGYGLVPPSTEPGKTITQGEAAITRLFGQAQDLLSKGSVDLTSLGDVIDAGKADASKVGDAVKTVKTIQDANSSDFDFGFEVKLTVESPTDFRINANFLLRF